VNKKSDRKAFLAQVASLYYDKGVTQQEISELCECSRSAVSRFLTEARELGIVEIIVHYPWRTSSNLEQLLKERFSLSGVRVLISGGKTYDEILQGLGSLGADEFENLIESDSVIGMSWGTALHEVVASVHLHNMQGIEVVQMIGATGSVQSATIDGPILAQRLAHRLGGTYWHLHAPLIVESEQVHKALLADRNIRETLNRAQRAVIALVGIGSTQDELYSILRAGYITKEEAAAVRSQGAVGDICGQHFDSKGQLLSIDINKRVIGISLENLKQVPAVIAVAGGIGKARAIRAALRGGHVNYLVTDEDAAKWIIAHLDS
jgi:DNA-binding transcriptional regulator LsrR (DeoR family)